MAALSANVTEPPRHIQGGMALLYPANAADEFYIGAIVCASAAATVGFVVVDNADADTTLGIGLDRVTVTASGDLVEVWVKGVWWIAAAGFTDANFYAVFAPTAASDNPADLILTAIGTPSSLGTLIHISTTAVDGYLDLDQRVLVPNV